MLLSLIHISEYDSLPWEWEKAGDPRWEVELIRGMAYGEGDLSVIAKGTLAMMEKFGLPKSWLDRNDGATNSNLIYNGFPNHHGPAEAWQVGMLYNLCLLYTSKRSAAPPAGGSGTGRAGGAQLLHR